MKRLPDCKETIDHGMMQHEKRVKGRVIEICHMAIPTSHAMDQIVDRLKAVRPRVARTLPGIRLELGEVVVCGQEIVYATHNVLA